MSTIPHPLPLSLEAAQALFTGDASFADVRGVLLCFVMIPVEERIGEWRFAGVASRAVEIVQVLDHFIHAMSMSPGIKDPALDMLSSSAMMIWDGVVDTWSYGHLPLEEIGKHEVVLLAEGGAPYDDFGLCIVEIPSLEGSPFENRAPETTRPEAWEAAMQAMEDEDDEE
ncbi:hypothetical protein [Polyangium jinanense]|uniref:Uncharacterized protein n=1 Tax=Polyangium jinanense TaxID=2829994 RepID=A0A9X3X1M5_9BACT|nr:hypothetical protein [Polyangium jinanense]MDC3955070.1 hypothetical protein [Polyangium jinanense]MDC3981160.1 hypothetical protein [Polyangium jinanense]